MADAAPPPQSGRDARKQAKADVAAAKARAKAERPLWKKPWFWILALIVVVVVASMAGGDDTGTTTGDTAQEDAGGDDGGSERSGIGQPAEDGNFTFTVQGIDCGVKTLGNNQFTRTKAQGEFCIAEMTVENHGDEASLMDGSSQYLFIGDKRYSADTDAIFADKRAEAFFIEEINPGLTVDGIIVWDVPSGSQPEKLELHDSPFSDGVEVTL